MNSFRRCCTDVIAPKTDNLLTLDLMLEAVPYSSANILLTRLIWSPGGIIRDIIDVPFPLAACRDLMSFLTFQISTFLSFSDDCCSSDIFSKSVILNVLSFLFIFYDNEPSFSCEFASVAIVLLETFFLECRLRKATVEFEAKVFEVHEKYEHVFSIGV